MSTSSSTGAAPAFVQGSSEPLFPLGGAVLLILLLLGGVVLILWARSRGGRAWRAPWAVRQGDPMDEAAVPRLLSSMRLDPVHRVHVIAWDDRQFLVATGAGVPPVVVASTGFEGRRSSTSASAEIG